MWSFIQNEILGMQWLNRLIGSLIEAVGLDPTSRIGGSVQFFFYDIIKIMVLLGVLIFVISYIQSYFPPERTKKILGKFHGIGANCVAALLGTVTPFCSCSSIPLFIGFTSAGLPLGVRLTFTDDPSDRDYYAMWIFRSYQGVYSRAEYFVNQKDFQSLSVNMDSHPMLVQLYYTFGEAAYRRPSACMIAFSDVDFDGERVTKEFLVPYYPGDPKYTYHIELLKMSQECWRCVEADFNMIMNDFSEYGQAAIYPYTNVIGGIGAFGAISPITSMDLVM